MHDDWAFFKRYLNTFSAKKSRNKIKSKAREENGKGKVGERLAKI